MNKNSLYKIMASRKASALLIVGLTLLMSTATVFAADSGTVETAANKLNTVFCNIAHLVFIVAGGVAALVMIMAGLRWVTSSDDPGARNAAKTTIISAIIGLVIIMVAVYIVSLVVNGMLPGAMDITQWMGDCPSTS